MAERLVNRRRVALAAVCSSALTALACTQSDAAPPSGGMVVVDTLATPATVPFESPVGGVVLPDGRLAVVDAGAEVVFVLRPDGTLDTTLGRPGAGPGELRRPRDAVLRGDTIAVINAGNGRVENFLLGGAYAGSRPLPAGVQSQQVELTAGDTVLMTTTGTDSALARLVTPEGEAIVRYGTPVVSAGTLWDFGAIKATIREGKIPDQMRNVVLLVGAPNGDVWLVLHTEGLIQRFDASGRRLAEVTLPDSEIAPIREEFFRANADEDRPNVLRSYLLASSGAADRNGAWFLLARPDSLPAVLLHVAPDGAIDDRLEIPGAEGAWHLVWDPPRNTFYLLLSRGGMILRVRRQGQ